MPNQWTCFCFCYLSPKLRWLFRSFLNISEWAWHSRWEARFWLELYNFSIVLRVEQWTLSFNKGVEFIVGNEIRVIEALFECAKCHYYNSKRSFFFHSLSITLRILLRQPKVLFILFQFYCFIFPQIQEGSNLGKSQMWESCDFERLREGWVTWGSG